MSHRSDTVRSITLIAGSAFAAVGLTTFLVMAKEKPAEQPTPPTEVTTVVVEPMSVSGFVVGKVEPAHTERLRVSRSLVVSGSKATGPIVFVDGHRMERTDLANLLRDVNPSFNVNIQPISDAPGDAGSRSDGKKPDGNDR
jgi:hypothetical protein